MAKLSYKASYYLFYILMAINLIVLGMFFGVGYNNPVGDYNEPQYTETLIFLMYAMCALCILVTVIAALGQFVLSLKDNPKAAIKSLGGVILLIAVIFGAYAMGSDAPLAMADGTEYTDATWLKLTDCMIYSSYFLIAVAGIGTIINLSGIFKR